MRALFGTKDTLQHAFEHRSLTQLGVLKIPPSRLDAKKRCSEEQAVGFLKESTITLFF